MHEVFSKIIEKQEELFQDLNVIEVLSHVDFDSTIQNSLKNFLKSITKESIEIVKKEAEKFGTDTNVGSNGWIPCSSGVLPKRPNSYCVTKMCENDGNPIYETCHEIFWTNDNKWDCERDEDCEWRVIAWKEKDKPYQPKGE